MGIGTAQPAVSAVICTHNPRMDHFNRVLHSLRSQTLSTDEWELLVIDNKSDRQLVEELGLEWHPRALVIREDTVGLTPARVRAVKEATCDLMIFCDDDGVLDDDYLENALRIASLHPQLGAWGAGNIRPEFEEDPPEWTREHWARLAIRTTGQEVWSNFAGSPDTTPWGVGLCVRRAVAIKYCEDVAKDPLRQSLDRTGSSLVSGGDEDLARTAYAAGMGTGLFPELRLTHLIPPSRLEEQYLLWLTEAQSYSGVLLSALHGKGQPTRIFGRTRRRLGRVKRYLTMSRHERMFAEARLNGQQRALVDISRSAPHLLHMDREAGRR